MPLTTRQQAAQDATQLNSFGSSQRETLDAGSQFVPEDELDMAETLGGLFIQKIKDNIDNSGMAASGRIGDITIQRTETGFDIMAYKYLQYQDEGVNGTEISHGSRFSFTNKRPPMNIIKDWLLSKKLLSGLTPEQQDEFAFNTAAKIYTDGIMPTNVLTRELEQFSDDVANAAGNLVVSQLWKTDDNKPRIF